MSQETNHKIEFYFYRMDRCPNCLQNTLDIYDYFNTPLGYKQIVDQYVSGERVQKGMLNKRAFYTFRCKNCAKTFPIIWDRGFPIPDKNPLNLKIFLNAFKDGGKD